MRPERLIPTRVYRFYQGGLLIDRLRGDPERDTDHPEDWVGSVTAANNPGRDEPEAGLSRLDEGPLLRDAIAADPEGWLGPAAASGTTGLLVKLLDAAQRLPVHAHPSRGVRRRSISVAVRQDGGVDRAGHPRRASDVWIGMRETVDPATYRGWIESQDVDALLGSLHRVPVRAGDVIYVPAGTPHAIGAGVLIAELQEPTDFSIVCEWQGFPIEPADSHLGMGWDVALGALDLARERAGAGAARGGARVLLGRPRGRAGRQVRRLDRDRRGGRDRRPARAGRRHLRRARCGGRDRA